MEELNSAYNKMDEVFSDFRDNLSKKLEAAIRERLAKKGFVFDNYDEFLLFGKQCCRVVSCNGVNNLFAYDSILICSWGENYQFEHTDNSIKASMLIW